MSEIGKNYITSSVNQSETATTMTVYSALNKRKIYLDRLNKLSSGDAVFLDAVLGIQTSVNGMSREDFENKCKSNYDKAIAIIRNFYALNAAITQSNALTKVVIADTEYTVAEAIVRYDRLNNEIAFLNQIISQVAKVRAKISRSEVDILSEKAVSDHVAKVMSALNFTDSGSDENAILAMKDKIAQDYIKNNTYSMIDPYELANNVEEKSEQIKEFMSEFNEAINICNMQTTITVNLISD